ncbi:MAG: GNAT family N-acetyltransferase [Xanthomonadales bacterium]|nr:GNAT family N-acetyltransferase [Xanthomonadales bacterium]
MPPSRSTAAGELPELLTAQLRLRGFHLNDAAEVQRLAGDARVAATTANIPHPYPDGAAAQWIGGHLEAFQAGTAIALAITRRSDARLLGTVSLTQVSMRHARAELGYWIGVEYWGQGHCTAAAAALIDWAQMVWGLSRVCARCLASNPASARVLEKLGFAQEGRLCLHERRGHRFEDLLLFGRNSPDRNSRQRC